MLPALLAVALTSVTRRAEAQTIRVGAFVTQPAGVVASSADSSIAAPPDIRRVRIDETRSLDVRAGAGAVVRTRRPPVVAPMADSSGTAFPPSRLSASVTIEFVGS